MSDASGLQRIEVLESNVGEIKVKLSHTRQHYNVGEKPTLYCTLIIRGINRHSGTPNKKQTKQKQCNTSSNRVVIIYDNGAIEPYNYVQPMIPPKRFDIFPPDWGMHRRSLSSSVLGARVLATRRARAHRTWRC